VKRTIVAAIILALTLTIALPAVAMAVGDQVQHGRPAGDMPYAGAGDRTGGDWGNPDNAK
jgi:hypothetical protein